MAVVDSDRVVETPQRAKRRQTVFIAVQKDKFSARVQRQAIYSGEEQMLDCSSSNATTK